MLILLGWCGLVILVAWCLAAAAADHQSRTVGWKWWAVTGAVLLCFRWELVLAPFEFNPDEAHLIAGAMTLRADPIFWRSVDGITAGPLDFYPLLPATFTQGLTSFTIARLTGLAATLSMWIFAGESLGRTAGAVVARAVVLPALVACSFTQSPDFLYYSTEAIPLVLLSAATWFTVRQVQEPGRMNLWAIGLLLGAVPWAKLQATPIAAMMWIVIVGYELRRTRRSNPTDKGAAPADKPAHMPLPIPVSNRRQRSVRLERNHGTGRALVILFAAGLLPSFGILVITTATGQAHHMLISYWLNNVEFVRASSLSIADTFARQWSNALGDGFLGCWTITTVVFSVASAFQFRRASTSSRCCVMVVLLLLVGVLVSVLSPRRPTMHYLHFIELPLILLGGGALAMILSRGSTAVLPSPFKTIGIFLLAGLAPQFVFAALDRDPAYVTDPASISTERRNLAATVRNYAVEGEALAVWGWRSAVYVDTGLVQGTREGQFQPQINPGRWRQYFRERYLADLERVNSPVFIDAVGEGNYVSDRTYAHESFPLLDQFISAEYTLVSELDSVRVYVRNDRLKDASMPNER